MVSKSVAQQVDFQQYFCFVLFFLFWLFFENELLFSTVDSMSMLYNNTNSMTQHNKEKKMVSKSIFFFFLKRM